MYATGNPSFNPLCAGKGPEGTLFNAACESKSMFQSPLCGEGP